MAEHSAELFWKPGENDEFLTGRYSRVHQIRFDGGLVVDGSASPSVVRAPWSSEEAADPEELFVASLSSCHMLWFLDFARRAQVEVRAYTDRPSGQLGKNAEGRIAMLKVTLRPYADCDADRATLEELHHKAHEACFIANSVKTDIVVDIQRDNAINA
jgi:organic hydroperoxide reductase OsmC/OhrA